MSETENTIRELKMAGAATQEDLTAMVGSVEALNAETGHEWFCLGPGVFAMPLNYRGPVVTAMAGDGDVRAEDVVQIEPEFSVVIREDDDGTGWHSLLIIGGSDYGVGCSESIIEAAEVGLALLSEVASSAAAALGGAE